MYYVFTELLNRSLTAGIMILIILLIRVLFRRCPKRYICLLWALAAVRLLVPIHISSSISAFNLLPEPVKEEGQVQYFTYSETPEKPRLEFDTPFPVNDDPDPGSITVGRHTHNTYLPPVLILWSAGVILMLSYAAICILRIRRKTAAAISIGGRRYQCDEVESPVILGIFRPRIYLPSGLDPAVIVCVQQHEEAHIRRKDHWWKPLGFLILTLFWFHPLIWIGYICLCRDIEGACDEAVLKEMTPGQKADYSQALLSCAVRQRVITVCPVAFCETDVKKRVKNVLSYRKPKYPVIISGILICIVAAVFLLTDPKTSGAADDGSTELSDEETCEPDITTVETLHSVETKEPAVLGDEMVRVCAHAAAGIMGNLTGESNRSSLSEENCSAGQYLVTRYLQLRGGYFRRVYGDGITDLQIGVSVDEGAVRLAELNPGKEYTKQVPVTVMASYRYENDSRYSEDFPLILTVTADAGGYQVTDIAFDEAYIDYLFPGCTPSSVLYQAEEAGEDPCTCIDRILPQLYDSCGYGDMQDLQIAPMESELYTEEDFQSAIDAVKVHFRSIWGGCSLTELYYPGDEEAERWHTAAAWHDGDTMVLQGTWVSGSEGTTSTSINADSVYDHWTFILRRNAAGGWYVADSGC